ncbi:lipocalin-like domain-containing protein [Capnocytophaga canimorsus]|uniref:lipocalin family protein n=1 Tax=Capnocytophaga canimorsus TaxID=28188 RepID=UPI000F83152A|nr:lipocalin family protein [Capnocytophaga canimorsus]
MKKIITLVLIAIMALVSCGKDDNPQKQDEKIDIKQLIGQWRLQSVTENGKNLLNDCNKQDTYVFKSDNTYTKMHYAVDGVNCRKEDGHGTFAFKGNLLTFINGKTGTEETGNFIIKENTLTLSSGSYTAVYEKIENPLIGKWKLQGEIINGEKIQFQKCEKEFFMNIEEKTITNNYFKVQGDNCVEDLNKKEVHNYTFTQTTITIGDYKVNYVIKDDVLTFQTLDETKTTTYTKQ